jgi:hypothetical protein
MQCAQQLCLPRLRLGLQVNKALDASAAGVEQVDAHSAADFCHIKEPLFCSKAVHGDFVDSVAWFGDALLTKSVTNEAVLWRIEGLDLADSKELGLSPTGGLQVRC